MTDEQIALIKYAIRAENKKTAQVLGKLKVPVDDYESPLAKALRAALAMAEQARAMDGWVIMMSHKGERHAVDENHDGTYSAFVGPTDDAQAQVLTVDGKWSEDYTNQARFPAFIEAIKAANVAMKAGQA